MEVFFAGSCCDLDTCTIRPRAYPCRPVEDSECDLEEFCDGVTEWCPEDTHKIDGTTCNNGGETWCHNGQCRTHQSQCRAVWGDVRMGNKAADGCYNQFNVEGA